MEREPIVLEKQRAMQHAGAVAINALRTFSDQSIDHAASMTEQAGRHADGVIRSFKDTVQNSAEISEAQRKDILADFSYFTSDTIDQTNLSGDLKLQAKAKANDLLILLINKYKTDNGVIDTKVETAVRVADERDGVRKRVVDSKLEVLTRKAQSSAGLSGGAQNHLQTIYDAISDLEFTIDYRHEELAYMCRDRAEGVSLLISDRHNDFLLKANGFKADFEIRLAALIQQGAARGNQQKNTGQAGDGGARRRLPPNQNDPRPNAPSQVQKDPRIAQLMGKSTGEHERPYAVLLANIDHHRAKGKTDTDIYRLLIRNFHPDTSTQENAESISRVLTAAYDKSSGRFLV